MRTRKDLSNKLRSISGLNHVYYRPPSEGMIYPCIKYDLDGDSTFFADNIKYINPKRWKITVIDENPDSEIPDKVNQLQFCSFDRRYESGGMNHWVYILYF